MKQSIFSFLLNCKTSITVNNPSVHINTIPNGETTVIFKNINIDEGLKAVHIKPSAEEIYYVDKENIVRDEFTDEQLRHIYNELNRMLNIN